MTRIVDNPGLHLPELDSGRPFDEKTLLLDKAFLGPNL
ncbi:hypothetical protein ACPOL_5452 [Acidisarcina polymorpha]|uniref:Uncharacterized protein n=1 Tax=Acidisarcina polymorpha TaxID=2211140 RepID=A0A2Z5G6V0_9BACT|nr:hypothetical protein ACPOL_5452 [Acidisarcina polymorpha]